MFFKDKERMSGASASSAKIEKQQKKIKCAIAVVICKRSKTFSRISSKNYFSTDTPLSPASFSSLITCSAFSANASLWVTAIICSIALKREIASARRFIEPSSLPRL
jgi:hypothetical protein